MTDYPVTPAWPNYPDTPEWRICQYASCHGHSRYSLAVELLQAFAAGRADEAARRLAADFLACHEDLCEYCCHPAPCSCWNDE